MDSSVVCGQDYAEVTAGNHSTPAALRQLGKRAAAGGFFSPVALSAV